MFVPGFCFCFFEFMTSHQDTTQTGSTFSDWFVPHSFWGPGGLF